MMTSPRGRLPARVYWFRRSLVLVLALLLVFVIARVLSGFGGDDASARASTVAQQGGAEPSHLPGTTLSPSVGTTPGSVPLSAPTGACQDSDVLVQPDVTTVPGGQTAPLKMLLTTSGDACTWKVSARTLVVKITSGDQRIWSSQDCPAAIPTTSVVVRPANEKASKVVVSWGGHRSVASCVKGQGWAGLGWYHVVAASLGGEPSDVQFRVVKPPRPVIRKTLSPSPTPTAKPTATPTKKPTAKPTAKPSKKATTKPRG